MHTTVRATVGVSIFLVLITAIFFGHALLSADQFFFGDISQNHYPARKLITDLEREGVFPLWNPYISSGQPLYANPNNLVFHPVSLFSFIFPFDMAFKYSIIFQYLLCAAGMYLFSKEMKLSVLASLLSSSLFTFSGFFLSLGHLYNLLSSAAWIPLFLLFFYRSISRSYLYVPAAAFLLSIVLLSAEPFFILSVLLISLALLFVPADGGSSRNSIFCNLWTLSIVLVAAILLSSFLLLPAAEFFIESERSAGLASETVSKWSLTPMEMLGIFIPHFFGDPLSLSVSRYWGSFYFKETLPLILSLYMGIPALLLATMVAFKRDRRSIIFFILLCLTLVCALGSNNANFRSLSERLPFFSSLRYTSKLFILASFSLSLLAGKGLDASITISEEKKPLARISLIIIPVCVTLFLMGIYYAGKLLPQGVATLLEKLLSIKKDLPPALLSSIQSSILGNIIHAAGVSLVATILFIVLLSAKIKKSIVAALFIFLVFIDLFLANGDLNPVTHPSFYERTSPFSEAIQEKNGLFRIYRERTPKDLMIRTRSGSKEEGFLWNKMVLLQWTALPERLSFAYDQNVDRLEPHRSDTLIEEAKRRSWDTLKKILDISSARYLILFEKIQAPQLSEIAEYNSKSNYPVILYRNSSAMPRFYAVPGIRMVQSEEESLREVLSGSFNPEEEAVVLARAQDRDELKDLERAKRLFVSEGDAERQKRAEERNALVFVGLCSIKIAALENNYLKLVLDAENPGFLVMTDSYYPGWICRINGHRSHIFRTNYIQRGIPFAKGLQTVEFLFQPRIFFTGIMISCITCAVLIGFCIFSLFKKRTDKRPKLM